MIKLIIMCIYRPVEKKIFIHTINIVTVNEFWE